MDIEIGENDNDSDRNYYDSDEIDDVDDWCW